MERPRILAENRALAWSVLTFSPEIALSRRASSHSRRKSRSRVERPRILAENRALEWSVLAFSPEIAVSRGASSHSRRKSRFRVERPHILVENRALAWSVRVFLLASAVTVELNSKINSKIVSRPVKTAIRRAGLAARDAKMLVGNRVLAWSVLAFSLKIALSRGASSHSRLKSRSRVERLHILA